MLLFFFFNDTATTEIYTLSLHDALPICRAGKLLGEGADDLHVLLPEPDRHGGGFVAPFGHHRSPKLEDARSRSEEHTSELQSRQYLVCRLLLEKKKYHSQVAYK